MDSDFLIEDSIIENQTHCCVSIITPETVKAHKSYNIRAFKFRGAFPNINSANTRAKFLSQLDTGYNIYCLEIGKWIAWCDDPKLNEDREYTNNELNEMIKQYYTEFKEKEEKFKERSEKLKKGENVEDDDILEEEEKSLSTTTNIQRNNNSTVKILSKKKELKSLSKQYYYCVSLITPESIKNKKFNVRGIKFRGVYETYEQAVERVNYLKKVDAYFNIYIGEVCDWNEWKDNPSNSQEQQYMRDELNNLMKTHEKKQQEAKMVNDFHKMQKVAKFLDNTKVNKVNEQVIDSEIDRFKNLINEMKNKK